MKGRKEGGEWRVGGKKETREREDERGERRSKEGDEFYTLLWLPNLYFVPKPFPPSFFASPSPIFMLLLYLCIYLQDGEVLKHAVHHVSLREVLQPMNETDHVVTHRRTVNTINKPTSVKSCIFSLEKGKRRKNLM